VAEVSATVAVAAKQSLLGMPLTTSDSA